MLSSSTSTIVDIDGNDFTATIYKTKFDQINSKYFEKCIKLVGKCLKETNMEKHEVDDIVLIGVRVGSQSYRKMLGGFFNGKQFSKSLNGDEAITCGMQY